MAKGRKQALPLYSAEGEKTCRIVRRVSIGEGDEHEALGLWARCYDGNTGDLIGFRMLAQKPDDSAIPLASSPACISTHEMQVNAGLFGDSRTVSMDELARLNHEKDGGALEDEIERVQAKVFVFPLVGSAKGDILRAWPKGVSA